MDDRLRQLRVRVRAHQRGQSATAVRYPESLREEIVAAVREAHAHRSAVRRLARDAGLPARTLTLWLRRTARRRFRRVALTTAAPAVAVPPPLVLTTPQGLRVEGLDLAGLVTVLRTLA